MRAKGKPADAPTKMVKKSLKTKEKKAKAQKMSKKDIKALQEKTKEEKAKAKEQKAQRRQDA